jgi:hypothetical protein
MKTILKYRMTQVDWEHYLMRRIFAGVAALLIVCAGCRTKPQPSSLRPWQGAVTNAQGEIVRPTW